MNRGPLWTATLRRSRAVRVARLGECAVGWHRLPPSGDGCLDRFHELVDGRTAAHPACGSIQAARDGRRRPIDGEWIPTVDEDRRGTMHSNELSIREVDDNARVNGSVVNTDGCECGVHASHRTLKIRAAGNGQHVDLHSSTVELRSATAPGCPRTWCARSADTTDRSSTSPCEGHGRTGERQVRAAHGRRRVPPTAHGCQRGGVDDPMVRPTKARWMAIAAAEPSAAASTT